MTSYDTTSSGFTLSEVDMLWYQGWEQWFASTAATDCDTVERLVGTRVWCTDKTSPGKGNMFSFLGSLYTGIVTVDPNSTTNAWYTNLLFGIQCYTNGHFTPNRPAS